MSGLNADQTKPMAVGETLPETQGFVQTVMGISAQVVQRTKGRCIFDQFMEYSLGPHLSKSHIDLKKHR